MMGQQPAKVSTEMSNQMVMVPIKIIKELSQEGVVVPFSPKRVPQGTKRPHMKVILQLNGHLIWSVM